jgi:hypothetical protein
MQALASAQAASAVQAAVARIQALEQSIAKLQSDTAASREAIALLAERAARGDSAGRWIPWLLALVAVLALSVFGLLFKLMGQRQDERQQLWSRALAKGTDEGVGAAGGTASSAAGGVSALVAEPNAAAMPALAGGGGGAAHPPVLSPVFTPDPPPGPIERTQALPMAWPERQGEAPRDVSIEELIDLEQQAEFFSVLGQDDAAIDLLVDYLRSTGGGSPMPYLKLLEIYRRQGDRESYDRTRMRFNHRFNALAPEWGAADHEGRSLEDYPTIVARLQQTWGSPIDAMAELESLLFRKSRGEMFDMPAYRDVLFLYALARDLMDRESVEAGTVDVLLPLSENIERTQPMSLDEAPSARDTSMAPLDNMPTMPPDVDLTQPAAPDSLFNETTLPLGEVRRWI